MLYIVCVVYTVVSIVLTSFEVIERRYINQTQINMLLFLLLSILSVVLMSQQYRLNRFSPLVQGVVQYVILIFVILISLFVFSHFVEVHVNGYRDILISFSVPYVLGLVIYFICLNMEVKKQNKMIKQIKAISSEKSN